MWKSPQGTEHHRGEIQADMHPCMHLKMCQVSTCPELATLAQYLSGVATFPLTCHLLFTPIPELISSTLQVNISIHKSLFSRSTAIFILEFMYFKHFLCIKLFCCFCLVSVTFCVNASLMCGKPHFSISPMEFID